MKKLYKLLIVVLLIAIITGFVMPLINAPMPKAKEEWFLRVGMLAYYQNRLSEYVKAKGNCDGFKDFLKTDNDIYPAGEDKLAEIYGYKSPLDCFFVVVSAKDKDIQWAILERLPNGKNLEPIGITDKNIVFSIKKLGTVGEPLFLLYEKATRGKK